MNLNILFQKLGSIDEKLDCLYPIYLLYPKIPKYKLIQDEEYIKTLVNKHFTEISITDVQKGNLLIFKFFNGFHFGIYAGNNKFFHCCNKHKLRLTNLSAYKKFLRGTFKWHH